MSGDRTADPPELIDISGYDFKALIFDCDGTLAETAPHHFNSLRSALAEQGLVLPTGWYFARLGLSRGHLFDEFDAQFNVKIDRNAAIARSEEIYCDASLPILEIKRVAGIAKQLRGQLPISVASGGPRRLVHRTLTACGLWPFFDHVVTFDDVGMGKPSPALFLEAARRMGVEPGDCLVFEDSDEGIEAAGRAAMAVVDVRKA
ncbi:HAD family phosphatase [Mesorhizobium sp.]|uniref:HAD family hydrolase n=1 Tax=Mesorhizobium sp. TaxID=1871066 RepID=UPI0025F86B5F|nr:HAD family phosphatase [Mesorhizobium sp.]